MDDFDPILDDTGGSWIKRSQPTERFRCSACRKLCWDGHLAAFGDGRRYCQWCIDETDAGKYAESEQ